MAPLLFVSEGLDDAGPDGQAARDGPCPRRHDHAEPNGHDDQSPGDLEWDPPGELSFHRFRHDETGPGPEDGSPDATDEPDGPCLDQYPPAELLPAHADGALQTHLPASLEDRREH